jgi:site-specific recombinase XerD
MLRYMTIHPDRAMLPKSGTALGAGLALPTLIATAGPRAQKRFLEFFTATIRNPNTRMAYARAVGQFLRWCERRGIHELDSIEPILVAAYVEQRQETLAKPSVKQHLAAIRMLFDWLVTGHIMFVNPAHSVRGPKHVIKRGSTPVLTVEETRALIHLINVDNIVGLRDRALIGVMVYSFARVGAVIGMRVKDYYPQGKRWWFRLHEKGGKRHDVPAHHKAEQYMDAYISAAGIADDKNGPLFRTTRGKTRQLTRSPMTRVDVFRMIKRRAQDAGLSSTAVCCHTFRATGITAYLENGGTLEHAQQIEAHESPRTTKLYDRTTDQISLDEIERIAI